MSKTIVTIASNATTAKLHVPESSVRFAVQDILSYKVNGAENMLSFKRGSWDGRSSFYNFKTDTFPAGFLFFVMARLKSQGYEVRHVKKPLPAPLGDENPVVDSFGYVERYDYQPEVIKRLLKHGQIIAQVATGGGKSRIARMAFARLMMPTLFLTTRGLLMYQMKDSFERELNMSVSVLGDGQFGHTIVDDSGFERRAVKKMCVGMVQTLISKLEEKTYDTELSRVVQAAATRENKEYDAYKSKLINAEVEPAKIEAMCAKFEKLQESKRPNPAELKAKIIKKVDEHMRDRQRTIDLLGRFGLVILEEAHEASGNSYYEILKYCKNAHYRLALTGTPFMKDDEEANMRLMACSGPIAIKVSEEMLIDRGILAQPHFKIVRMAQKPPKLMRHTAWQSAYRIGITDNEFRNNHIIKECRNFKRYGLNGMILVQQTKHGELLREKLMAAGLRVEFIQGEDNQEERKTALRRLANHDIDVLIGTTILDVGVDVPAVGYVVLAGGGKAEVSLRQRIGRGLREKKAGPNVCFIIDFADSFNDHLKTHASQRLAIIKGTPGFDRYIYENGADFDLEALGFRMTEALAA